MSSVSVIIPAHNAGQTIAWALDGVAEQDFDGGFEVVVVDDGSSDNTVELVDDAPLDSRIVHLEGVGAAHARNAGVFAARGEILAFLDADCRPTTSWLRAGVAALDDADLVQGATHSDRPEEVGPFDRTLWVHRPTGLYESANLFVRRDVFERVGGFEHSLGVGSGNTRPFGEDVWFGWRAVRLGARIGFCERALVHHAVFERGATEYVLERARLRYFPPLARRIPELRKHFFYHRVFLTRRSAAYDAALIGCALALGSRRWLALAATVPYLHAIAPRVLGGGSRRAGKMVLAELAADSVGFVALLAGSAHSGSLVL